MTASSVEILAVVMLLGPISSVRENGPRAALNNTLSLKQICFPLFLFFQERTRTVASPG